MNTQKDHLFLVPKDKPQEPILLSVQFQQIQQQAQQRVLQEVVPPHTTI